MSFHPIITEQAPTVAQVLKPTIMWFLWMCPTGMLIRKVSEMLSKRMDIEYKLGEHKLDPFLLGQSLGDGIAFASASFLLVLFLTNAILV